MRLIDADALIAEYDKEHVGEPRKARRLMECAPTIDAVPVTRCKNCDWCEPYGDYFFCEKIAVVCTLEDYCSFGEKRIY